MLLDHCRLQIPLHIPTWHYNYGNPKLCPMLHWQPSNSSCAAWERMAMYEGCQERSTSTFPKRPHIPPSLPTLYRGWAHQQCTGHNCEDKKWWPIHKEWVVTAFCVKAQGMPLQGISSGRTLQCGVSEIGTSAFCLTISTDGGGFVPVETPQGHIVISMGPMNKMVFPFHLPHCFPHLPLTFPGLHVWELGNWIQS